MGVPSAAWDIHFILHTTCPSYTHGWIYTIDRYYEILMNLYGTHIYKRIHSRYSLMKLFIVQHWNSSNTSGVLDVGLHNRQIPLIQRARVRWEPPPWPAPVRRPDTEDLPILLHQEQVPRGGPLLRRGREALEILELLVAGHIHGVADREAGGGVLILAMHLGELLTVESGRAVG
jgi:hypothetical protein